MQRIPGILGKNFRIWVLLYWHCMNNISGKNQNDPIRVKGGVAFKKFTEFVEVLEFQGEL